MNLVTSAIKVARNFYDEKTYYHVMRVAGYVLNDNLIPEDKMDKCVALAIMHDLLEDNTFDYEQNFEKEFNFFNGSFKQCLGLLTKDKDKTYNEYLQKIKDNYTFYPEAYWVKLSDIRVHLDQTETLTDKLKQKYYDALPILL